MSSFTEMFSKPKTKAVMQTPSPQIATTGAIAPNAEALRRAGRASLFINTSSQGVLGNAKTGRQSLLSA